MSKNKYREAWRLLCDGVPVYLVDPMKLNDAGFLELQEWAVNNARVKWMRGIDIIDAVCVLCNEDD